MPVTAVRTEKTIEEVVTRAFGRLSAADLKAVVTATLAANPHLKEGTALTPGTLVVVTRPRAVDAPADRVDAPQDLAITAVLEALGQYRDATVKQLEVQQAEHEEAAKLLKGARFRRIAEAIPQSAELLPGIEAALKEVQATNTESATFVRKELDTIDDDLRALLAD